MSRRPRRGNVVIISTRPAAIQRRPFGRVVRRRRFRLVRTSALLAVVAVIRLAAVTRSRWRPVAGVAGLLIEVVGFNVFSGGMQAASSVLGMALLLFALMKDARQCSSRRVPMAVRPPG